jgi:hypothetical protein
VDRSAPAVSAVSRRRTATPYRTPAIAIGLISACLVAALLAGLV